MAAVRAVRKDYRSSSIYFLNFAEIVGELTVLSYQVDPSSTITNLTFENLGLNNKALTDQYGRTYATSSLGAMCVTGGSENTAYLVPIRLNLSNGDYVYRDIEFYVETIVQHSVL